MKYFLSLILLSVMTISCTQDLRIINANKTASYTGTSGFIGWNINIKVKKNAKDIVFKYLLKDGQKCKIETRKLDSNQVELLTFEDLSKPLLSYGETHKKRMPPTNRGQIFYSIGHKGILKNVWIKEFKIIESKDRVLRQ